MLCAKRIPHKRPHSITNHTMPKRSADSTEARKRRKLADEVLEAARNGDTAAVREVLESGKLSPESFPRSKRVTSDAVHEACRGNHDECLALLLPYVETTQVGFGVWLSECVHTHHVACTEVLLQHWKSVCNNGACVELGEPVRGAISAYPAMWVDPAVCRVFIDAGADIETKTSKGRRSPLHLASRSGALEVVKMLVEAGADIDTRNDYGNSPLDSASQAGALEVVKVLVRAGAGVNVTDNDGGTWLVDAAYAGHTETVRYLVGLPEVAVHHRDSDNVADERHRDVEQVLIDAGDVRYRQTFSLSEILAENGPRA